MQSSRENVPSHDNHRSRYCDDGDEECRVVQPDAGKKCCESGRCGKKDSFPKANSSQKYDHQHGHDHSSCCDEDEECGSMKPEMNKNDSYYKKGESKNDSVSTQYSSLAKDDTISTEINLVVAETIKCQFCDPTSSLPHEFQVTRLRVANLCCVKEEVLLRKTLEEFVGIDQVAVNLIGKYAIVKHCGAECCAPGIRMIEELNKKHLGVSVQSINGQSLDSDQQLSLPERLMSWLPIIHSCSVSFLFLIGLIFSFIPSVNHDISQWIFIASVIIGIFPILRNAIISLFIQKLVDIHCLMLIAAVGAIIGKEYFDASLVVALFLDATLLEHLAMEEVKKAVSISSARTLPKEAVLVNGKTILVERLQIGDVIAVRAGEVVLCDGVITKGEGVIDESALTGESEPISKTVGATAYGGTIVQNGYLEIQVNKNPTEGLIHRLQNAVEEVQADRGHYATLVDQFAQYWTPFVLIVTMLIVVIGGGVTNGWWDFVNRGLVLLVLACPCAIVISAPIPSVCAISNGAKHGVLIRGSTIIEKMNLIDMVAVDKTGTLTKGFFTVNEKIYLGEQTVTSKTEEEELISEAMLYAAALEQKSTHPLANAVVSDYCGCIGEMEEMMLSLPQTKQLKILEGIGIEGWVQNPDDHHEWKPVVIGNERLFKPYGGKLSITQKQQKQIEAYSNRHRQGNVILFILVEDELKVMISLSDTLRPETKDFIHYLREEMLLLVTMLTGDHPDVASKICQECNIPLDSCYARLLPEEKLQYIQYSQSYYQDHPDDSLLWMQLSQHGDSVSERNPVQTQQRTVSDEKGAVELVIGDEENFLQQELISQKEQFESKFGNRVISDPLARKHHILMIGDGINDSIALAASTIGVAMGSGGTAMAVSAADVVLMTDNLLLVPFALSLSRYATRTIIENGVFAIAVKIVAVILAIIGLLELWQAVLIDIGSLLVVIINGMKVLRYPNKYFRLNATS